MEPQPTTPPRDPAAVSLAELLAAPELRLTCCSGADRLDRAVRWAHTTELLDPGQYLRGGELVCTVGSSLLDDDACARFALAVASAGGSGVCFGVGDVHDEVPPSLVDACQAHDLPLLLAPMGAPFIAVSEYLANRRVEAETAAGERSDLLLAGLLGGVRAHATPAELLHLASTSLGGRLSLSDGDRVLHSSGPEEPDDPRLLTLEVSAPDGTVLTWRGDGPPPTPALLATLVRVLDVARHERDVEQDLHRERVGQLLALVGERLADPSALAPALTAAGLAKADVVFSVWPSGAARVLAATLSTSTAVLGETPAAAVAVTSSAERVREAAAALGLPCGVSRSMAFSDAARGIGEARAAFELARRHGGCVGPEGLTSLEGLLEQQPFERLRPFIDQLIAPLVVSDEQRGTAHVRTLRTYLAHDGSLAMTAKSEFLHVNTVRHRLERVRELTGRDPQAFSDRVALAIGLWAHDHLDPIA